MLNQLTNLPKHFIAILAIGVGIGLLILNNPPHKFCDTQVKQFRDLNKEILFKNPKDKVHKIPLIIRLKTECRKLNSPGGCYKYFYYLKRFLNNFKTVSNQCIDDVVSIREVKKTFSSAINLIPLLAFSEEILDRKASKLNWLSFVDVNLFCRLKTKYSFFFGQESLTNIENKTLNQFPNTKKSSIPTLKENSLFSESCNKYLHKFNN